MINNDIFYGRPSHRVCDTPSEIENYDEAVNDNTQMWICHHRLETNFSDGAPRPKSAYLLKDELKALGIYFHRPAEELIFMKRKDHEELHKLGKRLSKETCQNVSKATRRSYYRCIETGEVKCCTDWINEGFRPDIAVRRNKSNSSNGMHFIKEETKHD